MTYPGQIPVGNALGNSTIATAPSVPTPGAILDSTSAFYKAGSALFPEYATQTTTTATSTNTSPTITVTSPVGINEFDLIGAAFVPFGTYVVSIVGSVVTMSADATATNVTPVATTFGQNRFQVLNSLLTNVLAAQVGNFGTAARGHGTWPGALSPALDLNWSSVYSISPIGQTALTGATRSSDNAFAGSNTIAQIIYVVADNPDLELFTWGIYNESTLAAGAIETSHIQYEGSLDNHWTISSTEDPYNINPGVGVRNMRLDNGKALASLPATCALDIVNNASGLGGGTYRSGIIIDATALDYTGGRPYAAALAMGAKQSLDWFTNNSGNMSWSVWVDDGTPTTFHMRDVFNADDFLSIDAGSGSLTLGVLGRPIFLKAAVKLAEYTVATLPAASVALEGAIAYVTDATAPTYHGAYVGGGAVKCTVWCDGAAWFT